MENENSFDLTADFFPYVKSEITVQDLGFRKSSFIGTSHRRYDFLLNNVYKCNRSYDEIYKFYKKILNNHPFIPIPKLLTKDIVNKITTTLSNSVTNQFINTEEFYVQRHMQITFFFNYINHHHTLVESKEFKKFFESEYDAKYFENALPYFDNSESNKYNGTKANVIGFFKGLVGQSNNSAELNNITHNTNQIEKELKNKVFTYESIKKVLDNYLSSLVSFIRHLREGAKIFEETCHVIDSTSIVNKEQNGYIPVASQHAMIFKDLSSINEKKVRQSEIIQVNLEKAIMIYAGIVESFAQYGDLLFRLDNVLRALTDSNSNPKAYNMVNLELEGKESHERKHIFEENFVKQLEDFENNNKGLVTLCLNSIFEILKSRNNEELDSINSNLK